MFPKSSHRVKSYLRRDHDPIGLADATISGNSLVVTSSTSFYSGILSFSGQLTSLSLLTPQTGNSGGNGYTMSFNAVPEPSMLGLLACGALAMGGFLYRRRAGGGGSSQPVYGKLAV